MFCIDNCGVCINISALEHKIIKLTCCKWRGEIFTKNHNREIYCCNEHRNEARKEKNRQYRKNHYHKWKKEGTLSIKQQLGGLGRG